MELHTGEYANADDAGKVQLQLGRLETAALIAQENELGVHAGHGLTFKSAQILSKINNIKEFNIGHFIIGESIFIGLSNVIKKFKRIIKN